MLARAYRDALRATVRVPPELAGLPPALLGERELLFNVRDASPMRHALRVRHVYSEPAAELDTFRVIDVASLAALAPWHPGQTLAVYRFRLYAPLVRNRTTDGCAFTVLLADGYSLAPLAALARLFR